MSILSMGNALMRGELHDDSKTGRWLWMRHRKTGVQRIRVDQSEPVAARKPRMLATYRTRSSER
ncbi:hypothetical protein K2Y11_25135 [bacterium]|nr:hypothetical protein [bacterium]